MSEYMAARMDDQITGAQSENERLADRIAELEAECARLRANIEAAARYGWEHPKWEWSAVKGGLDRFTDAARRGKG